MKKLKIKGDIHYDYRFYTIGKVETIILLKTAKIAKLWIRHSYIDYYNNNYYRHAHCGCISIVLYYIFNLII